MTLRKLIESMPMGLGVIVLSILLAKVPSLAAKLDMPISDVEIDFADDTCWLASTHLGSLLEGDNVAPSDNGPSPEGDSGPLPGALVLAG